MISTFDLVFQIKKIMKINFPKIKHLNIWKTIKIVHIIGKYYEQHTSSKKQKCVAIEKRKK